MRDWLTILVICVLIGSCAVLSVKEVEDEAKLKMDLYCEMVSIRKATNDPLLGWPDYKGIYDQECVNR